jgi:hypothetical protein
MNATAATFSNFGFLAARYPELERIGARSERYFSEDPIISLMTVRRFVSPARCRRVGPIYRCRRAVSWRAGDVPVQRLRRRFPRVQWTPQPDIERRARTVVAEVNIREARVGRRTDVASLPD